MIRKKIFLSLSVCILIWFVLLLWRNSPLIRNSLKDLRKIYGTRRRTRMSRVGAHGFFSPAARRATRSRGDRNDRGRLRLRFVISLLMQTAALLSMRINRHVSRGYSFRLRNARQRRSRVIGWQPKRCRFASHTGAKREFRRIDYPQSRVIHFIRLERKRTAIINEARGCFSSAPDALLFLFANVVRPSTIVNCAIHRRANIAGIFFF